MDALQRLAVREALRKAFCGKWFDVGGVSSAARVLGVDLHTHTQYPVLNALHCAHWENLTEAERWSVVELVMDVLGVDFRSDFAAGPVVLRIA